MITLRRIPEVAADLGIPEHALIPWGRHAAKVDREEMGALASRGKLVLVSAISPTENGEGKTTVSVSLAMALWKRRMRAALCLREPSLGPVFGKKGGGTGGGVAQVEPAESINLHFTGDMHAITSAHNLLAALIDNDLHFGSRPALHAHRVTWPRVMDMNDRSLRHVMVGLGGKTDGVARETRFDITAASEIMACLCLAEDMRDLRIRLRRIVVGRRRDESEVTVDDLGGVDALLVLLRDALLPNLVQTREGTPAFVHGGPFANIAHGCSSVIASKLALTLADVVVTEAGFGFDLGGEKMLDIKCRSAGIFPHAVVLVATVRALRSHGAGDLALGLLHLGRQLENVRVFGLTPVVAINVFAEDREEDLVAIERYAHSSSASCARCEGFTKGGDGALALADAVMDALQSPAPPARFLYPLDTTIMQKLRAVTTALHGARDVALSEKAARDLHVLERNGHGALPVCIAKTPLSFSDDPKAGGLAKDFVPTVTELRVAAGAGFVVAMMGDVSTMPGLPRDPAAMRVHMGEDGHAHGLMQRD